MTKTMLLQQLRERVLKANLELIRRGLALYTFGNASGISGEDGLVVIKPSGVGSGLRDKHYLRKHGSEPYYGQAKGKK